MRKLFQYSSLSVFHHFTWIEKSKSTKWTCGLCSSWNTGSISLVSAWLPITNVTHFCKRKISTKPKIIPLCLAKQRPSTVAIKERVWSPPPAAKRWHGHKLLDKLTFKTTQKITSAVKHCKTLNNPCLINEFNFAFVWTVVLAWTSNVSLQALLVPPSWATGDVRHLGWFRSSTESVGSMGSLIASSTISCQRLVNGLHVSLRLAKQTNL